MDANQKFIYSFNLHLTTEKSSVIKSFTLS